MKRILICIAVAACSGSSNYASHDTTAAGEVSTGTAMVRGTVSAVSATKLTVTTDTGAVSVQLAAPVQVFDRRPNTLASVKPSSFIGVTTVKQPDGSERATEIHIFPEALRGLGEGSRMMAPNANANRMTNGSVSSAKPAGGGSSRMSNGNVASTNGSTIVVQYAGGSTTVTVPPTATVTEIVPVQKSLAAGDRITVLATKQSDGSLTSNRVMIAGK
jgi:hypothetical protein